MSDKKRLFVDCYSKEFDYFQQVSDVRNNVVVKKDSLEGSGILYAFVEGLLKPEQKLFVVVFCEEGKGKHFIREVRNVAYFNGYYIITWKPEVQNVGGWCENENKRK